MRASVVRRGVGALRWPSPQAATALAPKPTVILDLDETLLWRHGGWAERARLYLLPGATVGEPYPRAHRALAGLSGHFRFVAVTARNQLAERNTLHWLRHFGFGHIPVVHSSSVFPDDARRDGYKADAVRALCTEGWAPCVAGVGDRPSDLLAYASTGLHAIMVVHAVPGAPAEQDAQRALLAFDKLREAAAALPTASSPAGGGVFGSGGITYVTDVPAVLRAGMTDRGLVGRMHDPTPGSGRGSGGEGALSSPASARLPPVWEQVQSILMEQILPCAPAAEGSSGQPSQGEKSGSLDWGEEAGAAAYLTGHPAGYGRKEK